MTPTPIKLFVDTNIFVALKDKNDPTHQKAYALLDRIEKQDLVLFTSSDIVGETLTVLSRKLGKQAAKEFLNEYQQGGINEIFINETIHQEARELFEKTNSKNISFIDCTTAVAMKSQKIQTIFSFDQDFKKLGVSLI